MDVAKVFETEKLKRKVAGKRARLIVTVCVFTLSLMLALMLVFSYVNAILSKNHLFDDDTLSYLLEIVFYTLEIVIPFGLAALIFKKLNNKAEIFQPKRSSPKYGALYIVGTIGVSYILNLLMGLLVPDVVEFYNNGSSFSAKDPVDIVLLIIMVALLPAVLEEWAFRSVLLKNMLPYGRGGAILISSILFGIAHIDPIRIVSATVFGLLLGISYEYTGSIVFPMTIHFINNAIFIIGDLIPQNTVISLILGLLAFAFIGCGIAAITVYSIKGIKKHNISLIKKNHYGYSLSIGAYVSRMVLNFSTIPLLFIYGYIFIISYFPTLFNGKL